MSVLLDHPANLLAYRSSKPTAMVVVGDPRVRDAVIRHLWALGVRDVVGTSTIAEARSRAGTPRDLCIADVHLPDGSGLALLTEMRACGWPNGLALSAADDIGAVRSALAAGVRGYVVTGARAGLTPGHARQASMTGMAGMSAAPRMRPDHHGTDPTSGCRELSAREIEVLRLVAEGRSNKAIGQAMGLSALTVKSHLARIARKMGTGDRAGMVALALRAGIIN
ncbi:response regulator transcription factor [Yinghuangia sp. ASG 101]|uniref:response regulator transcription factor n=1 Tax=Yinghuangia sp. ASG 101 TaxID=2896848 RepID=UPI001E38890B|nr:response regulator transcription factor [Yinghuangia sp. ASG 101]UGQ13789.1 response regulator transcription factor [Yinghuangia sp. ASG 101]